MIDSTSGSGPIMAGSGVKRKARIFAPAPFHRALIFRAGLTWGALRCAVVLTLWMAGFKAAWLHPLISFAIVPAVAAAGALSLRRRGEQVVLSNLGVPATAVFLSFAGPAFVLELLLYVIAGK